MRILLVMAGGALGSAARYLTALLVAQRFGYTFPWGTLTVNVVGSFLIGLIAVLADEAGSIGPNGRIFLVVGVLGGFTTFSSFSLETLRLAQDDQLLRAVLNVGASLFLTLCAALVGIGAGRALAH